MRALWALVLIIAATAAGAYFAGHPGRVDITWQDWQIETSVGVLVGVVAIIALLAALLAVVVAALRRMPRNFRRRRAERRRRQGEAALTDGLVALAAGQAKQARRLALRAEALLDDTTVALLLAAEAATREGDAAAARRAYSVLLDRPEAAFLGLRGLIGQALRGGDDVAARNLAERARLSRPGAPWLVEALLVLLARAGDWNAADDLLASAARRRALPAERARHHRGVVLHQLSLAAERRADPRAAAALSAKAQSLAPDLAAPACHRARLLKVQGRRQTALKVIKRAWRSAPHPDLAELYLELQRDATPLARAAAIQRLAARNPEAMETRLAVAEAALAAQLWGEARRQLTLAAAEASAPGPSRRLCRLMAELEEGEAGNLAGARAWLDRAIAAPADPCHVCTACSAQSAEWHPLCPQCGGFDTLRWQSPTMVPQPIAAGPPSIAAPLMLPAPLLSGEAGEAPVAPIGLASRPQ